MALLVILPCILSCIKCYCRYKILSKREESAGRVSYTNGNGTSREDSVGPIGGYNGGFNGEPAGGYNLPSIEVQYPRQQYTNPINVPFTSRKDSGKPAGDYNLPPREAQYPERGQYFLTGQFFTKNQPWEITLV